MTTTLKYWQLTSDHPLFLGFIDLVIFFSFGTFFTSALACLEAALAHCGRSTLCWRHTLRALCHCRRSKRQFTLNYGDGYKRKRDGGVRGGVQCGLEAGYASRQRVYTEVVSLPFQVSQADCLRFGWLSCNKDAYTQQQDTRRKDTHKRRVHTSVGDVGDMHLKWGYTQSWEGFARLWEIWEISTWSESTYRFERGTHGGGRCGRYEPEVRVIYRVEIT